MFGFATFLFYQGCALPAAPHKHMRFLLSFWCLDLSLILIGKTKFVVLQQCGNILSSFLGNVNYFMIFFIFITYFQHISKRVLKNVEKGATIFRQGVADGKSTQDWRSIGFREREHLK